MKEKKADWLVWLLLIGFLAVLALAAREDYNTEVLDMMDTDTYEFVKSNLHEGCSDSEIVDEYIARKEWYDCK